MYEIYIEPFTTEELLEILLTAVFIFIGTFIYQVLKTCPALCAELKSNIRNIFLSIKNCINIENKRKEYKLAESYYSIIQNVLFELINSLYAPLNLTKPNSTSELLTTGDKVTESAFGFVYNYELLLASTSNVLEESHVSEILKKELIKKSSDGFQGIIFNNGFPVITPHEILYINGYMHIRLIVLWDQSALANYQTYLESKRNDPSISTKDAVF